MKITIHTSSGNPCELRVGTAHHPYLGPLPKVGETLVIPADAAVEDAAKGIAKITKIVWHYNAAASALWPELICSR